MTAITLPGKDGGTEKYLVGSTSPFPAKATGAFNRIALAAAHVVADPGAMTDPWDTPAIDWDATLAYRRHLIDLGFGVAEAMDTAQRGMGLSWPRSLELIERSLDAVRDLPGAVIASGAGTDQLEPGPGVSIDDVIAAYCEQCAAIEKAGGRIILMASRALAAAATSPDDYVRVYDRILRDVRQPVILHWLGDMFDPALARYWGRADHMAAMEVCLGIIGTNAAKIDGIKISLLDKSKEIVMRRRLPEGVRMYTGDDFDYAEMIEGDEMGHSDALLGIFDAIAPAASAALSALAEKDTRRFHDILAPTVALSRHIFCAPTRYYKTGIVFMAYLNDHQNHFTMVGGQQSARSITHFAQLFVLADKANLLTDPVRAVSRMKTVLALHGMTG
ncbi:MAG: dihydrodipicolinate synthase family protein [Alphaproteobacteria bacterium]|nr:dihydrodipicolinate synthase family protein [Alphaproteobacteria bacterium]